MILYNYHLFPFESLGIIKYKRAYATIMPSGKKRNNKTYNERMIIGSTLQYLAIPEQMPKIFFSAVFNVNFFSISYH